MKNLKIGCGRISGGKKSVYKPKNREAVKRENARKFVLLKGKFAFEEKKSLLR